MVLGRAEFRRVVENWQNDIRRAIRPHEPWALVGIKRRGAILAKRLWHRFGAEGMRLDFGELDISLYRDDYHLQHSQPHVLGTEIPFQVDGCHILLIDDVLFTGRTVRAALDLILDFGRPREIQLAVLIDRGHRELPISANITGLSLETHREDRVQVRLEEIEGVDEATLHSGGYADGG
jgi:pyrimidine operon attenuation protein/uracil phosphoribosyltransferase